MFRMTNESPRKWPVRILKALSIVCLILLVLSEGYSAAATALDPTAPNWERKIGWALFALPSGRLWYGRPALWQAQANGFLLCND